LSFDQDGEIYLMNSAANRLLEKPFLKKYTWSQGDRRKLGENRPEDWKSRAIAL